MFILRHLLQKLPKTDFKFRFSDMKLDYKHIYRQFKCYLIPLIFPVFLDDPFFVDFKFLLSRKWTVMFRNRNFWLQIRIFWVNPILGAEFYESRFKIAIMRDKMSIFYSPCIYKITLFFFFQFQKYEYQNKPNFYIKKAQPSKILHQAVSLCLRSLFSPVC